MNKKHKNRLLNCNCLHENLKRTARPLSATIIFKLIFLFIFLGWILSSCDESLPPRIEPQNVLTITNLIASQGTVGSGKIVVTIIIAGENIYHETFHDTVYVKGNIDITWLRKPDIEINIPLNSYNFYKPRLDASRILTLEPGQQFLVRAQWGLLTDEGESILSMLNYPNPPSSGIVHATPEDFEIQVQLTIFKEIGLLTSEPDTFTLKAWKKVGSSM